MAGFRTEYEKQKWQTLESSASVPLQRIADGTASKEDVQQLQRIIGRFSGLASTIFNTSIKSIEEQAQERIAKIQARRAERNKPLLEEQLKTLTETAIGKGWADQGPSIARTVSEVLESELGPHFEKQTKDLGSIIDRKLDRGFSSEPTEEDTDVQQLKATLAKSESRNTLVDRKLQEIKEAVDGIKSSFSSWKSGPRRSMFGRAKDSVARAVQLLRTMLKSEPILRKSKDEGLLKKIWEHLSAKPKALARSAIKAPVAIARAILKTPIALAKAAISAPRRIAKAAKELPGRALWGLLSKLGIKKKDKDSEEKRANIWWRALKATGGLAGSAWSYAKRKGLGLGLGLLALGGRILATQLFGGTLWKKLDDYLSVDNIKKFGSEILDFVVSGGRNLVDWLGNKLDSIVSALTPNRGKETLPDGKVVDRLSPPDPNAKPRNGWFSTNQHLPSSVAPLGSGRENSPIVEGPASGYIDFSAVEPKPTNSMGSKMEEAKKDRQADPTSTAPGPASGSVVDAPSQATPSYVPRASSGGTATPVGSPAVTSLGMTKTPDSGIGSSVLPSRGNGQSYANQGSGTVNISPTNSISVDAGTSMEAPSTVGGPKSGRPMINPAGGTVMSMDGARIGSSVDGLLGALNLGMFVG